MEQISCGQDTHASPNHDTMNLKHHCLETFLPVFTNTQMVESSVKDTEIVKSTGRDEEITSLIAMVRSCMTQSASLSTKSDTEHIIRIRKSENSRETVSNEMHVKHMMKHMLTCFPSDMNANEIEYCRDLLQKDHHYRNNRLDRFENAFDLA